MSARPGLGAHSLSDWNGAAPSKRSMPTPRVPTRTRPAAESAPPSTEPGARSHEGAAAAYVAATQVARGRAAGSPTEITASGWKDILYRVYLEFNQDRVLSVAAGVAAFEAGRQIEGW